MPPLLIRKLRSQVDSLRKSLVFRGSAAAFIIKALSTGIAFVLQVLLARWLGVDVYGEYIYALTWVNLFTLVGQGGFQNAGKKYVSIYKDEKPTLLKGFIVFSYSAIAGMSLLVFLVFFLSAKLFQYNMSHTLLQAIYIGALMLLFNGMTQNTIGVLQGFKEIVRGFGPHNVLRPLLIIIGVFVLFQWTRTDLTAPVAMGVNTAATFLVLILTVLFMFRYLPSSFRRIRAEFRGREWIRVTIPMFLIASLGFILNRTDILILGIMMDTSQAGIYAVASRIASLILFGTFAVNAIVAPIIAKLYTEGKIDELQRIIKRSTRGLIAYALPACIGLLLLGGKFLGLFGSEFVEGRTALVILTAANTLTAFFGTVMYIMMMTNNQNPAAMIMLGVTILNAIMNIMLIPILGIMGAALATGLSTVIWNLSFYLFIRRRLAIDSSPL